VVVAGGGRGGAAVRVILINEVINLDGNEDDNGKGSAFLWSCWSL